MKKDTESANFSRPWYLTAFLIVATILTGLGVIINIFMAQTLMVVVPKGTQWSVPVFIIIGVVRLLAIYYTCRWRRFGVYLYAGCTVVAILISFMVSIPASSSLPFLIGLITLVLVVRPVWYNFR
jgi:hypothetical protein